MANASVQQQFGRAAADYAASPVHAKGASLARMLALVNPQADWRALDVATGAGHTALAFAPHVKHVIASDITEEMLAQAHKLAVANKLCNVESARADAAALAFDDESFNLVTCRLAAHHFTDPAAFVGEAWRVLTPGGTLALVDNVSPDAEILPQVESAALREAAITYNAFERLRDPSHRRCLALSEWLELLADAGFVPAHAECMDQDIAFSAWVQRMRCGAAVVAQLQSTLVSEPLRTFLKPRIEADGLVFTLQEAVIVARKPDRE